MSYIYKIINAKNGKVYIGQTKNNINKRFKQHIYDSRKERYRKRKLYKAFKKYGIDSFKIELIEECSKDMAHNRERYWIEKYNSFYNGYNENFGGSGNNIYNHNYIEQKLKEFPFPYLVAKDCNCSRDVVYNVAKNKNIKVRNYNHDNCININDRKTIIQYDKTTNSIIKKFNSVTEASEWLLNNNIIKKLNSGVRSHLGDVANGKRKSAYGFIWKYPSN